MAGEYFVPSEALVVIKPFTAARSNCACPEPVTIVSAVASAQARNDCACPDPVTVFVANSAPAPEGDCACPDGLAVGQQIALTLEAGSAPVAVLKPANPRLSIQLKLPAFPK